MNTQNQNFTALNTFLRPLEELFKQDGITEISINTPGEAWIEIYGEMEYRPLPEFTLNHLMSLGRLVAQSTEQMVSEEKPLLSATLPAGFRIQVVFPPACQAGTVCMSIRKQTVLNFDLEQYEAIGAFQNTMVKRELNKHDLELRKLLDEGAIREFITKAVLYKKNIIISGGTSTGKTTFLNAVLKKIPHEQRVITCEDARELDLTHLPNKVHLLASRGGQGRAKVTMTDLIEACLRLRPDRIMVGEIRGAEAFSYLRAINTGHPGSITTIHADDPRLAFEQLILMVMQAGLGITREQMREYVEAIVDVVVQLKRGEKGKRYVSEVFFRERH
ncbi:MAG: P-type DNA transfer ATPase VirB11 [Alphaproteobacteria bacterium]|nr:MAG: P-type DNA transfer ATPase VirB11 [Alphaproteobacteria bacterium]TAE80178.1 MAG: P-type DNA transfer ATPase VirB11 [Alphaproteobacteria bacterium]TAF14170.1 MAG: P-type DNA transfer ATPase VirB11 [Alphaproteobacteria bacterium]TAF39395.1 MAG: P-type DNA transfer ATPase VirB11 [Alphaproteobacteria bacterium]TAF74946.1 MAG: P-type DNA transfer ATPase VirB11 [Alphaproteobacteria bacterium]